MSNNIIEIKRHNSDSMIIELEDLLNRIKEDPSNFKNMIIVLQTENNVEIVNNKEISTIHLLGLLEFAKVVLTMRDPDDDSS
jgi:hypothetical protein